jgi:hypothetical protein
MGWGSGTRDPEKTYPGSGPQKGTESATLNTSTDFESEIGKKKKGETRNKRNKK